MDKSMLLGIWKTMVPVPRTVWQKQISGNRQNTKASLDFMSADHHRVRNFTVSELSRAGKPLSPQYIAQSLSLREERVIRILDDLEKHMTFVFRNQAGEVTWAYPVTVDVTPHRVTFSSGEKVFAA